MEIAAAEVQLKKPLRTKYAALRAYCVAVLKVAFLVRPGQRNRCFLLANR